MSHKIKYAYLIGDLGAGGQEAQLVYLVTLLSEMNERVLIFVWNDTNIDKYFGTLKKVNTELIVFPHQFSFLKKISIVRNTLKLHKPFTLHSFSFFLNFACWLSTLNLSTIGIGGIRNNIILSIKGMKRGGKLLGLLCVWFPKYKISNNHSFKVGLKSGNLNRRLTSTFIVTNQLDVNNFKVNIPLLKNNLHTASVGRFFPEKRIDILVQTIYNLKQRGIRVVHFHAGKGYLHQEILPLIKAHNLQDCFILSGEITDINHFLADKHFLIHSADYEGFPNVIMEAMACGKAVVSTNCGDASFMVREGENGYIVPIGDVNQLTEKCALLLSDHKKIIDMGINSRRRAEQLFKLGHLLTETIAVYSQLLADKN